MSLLRLLFTLVCSISISNGSPASSTDNFRSSCAFVEDVNDYDAPFPPPGTPLPPETPPQSPPPPSGTCQDITNARCGAILVGFSYQPQTRYNAGSLFGSNLKSSSATSCASTCRNTSSCVAFSQNRTDGSCSFHSSSALSAHSSDFDSWHACGTPAYSGVIHRQLLSSGPQLWSSPSTWPNGIVPGIGAAIGTSATIPCGQTVILDLPTVTLSVLRISGLLKFLDDPSLPLIYVKANFVIVEGQLVIGQAGAQFSQKAKIELTPNPSNRATYKYTFTPPAEPAYPRDLGHKAFAVVGGQLKLHGLPGPQWMPVWVRLSRPANDDDITIHVDKDVTGLWPIGGRIAVASSDYDRLQTETFTIVNVTSTKNGQSIITLDAPLVYKHYGDMAGYTDEFGGFIDERAEVALLSRNIVITGTDEPPPYHLEGGHFMVFMTNYPPQYIEGVEFYKMGQQGLLGRYSIHFHIIGSVPGTVCRKNSINQSKQRCIVLHATHNITIDSNVAFNNSGHCFMVEEGGETGNTFVNNLGILSYGPTKTISSEESDHLPSTFWMSNPNNKLIRNVGVGSTDSGFWYQLNPAVRGNSLSIPALRGINPRVTGIDIFVNNTAHSNSVGIRMYPNGITTRGDKMNIMEGAIVYKNANRGMFFHRVDMTIINNAVFADNNVGLQLHTNTRVIVQNSKFILYSNNYGNPSQCYNGNSNCMPIDPKDCRSPLKWGVPPRSTGASNRFAPRYGVTIDPGSSINDKAYSFSNITFGNYNYSCFKTPTFALVSGSFIAWYPGHYSQGLRFSPGTQRLWSTPINAPNGNSNYYEQANFYTMMDADGSLLGSPGSVVANITQLLPPGNQGCTARPDWNAYNCPGKCYRGLLVSYPEPLFFGGPANTRASYSYLRVTRISDGKVFVLDGNLQAAANFTRDYYLSLLSDYVYQIEILPPQGNASFVPSTVTVQLSDAGLCKQGLTVHVKQPLSYKWTIPITGNVYFSKCGGVAPFPVGYPSSQISIVCVSQQPWISFAFSYSFRTAVIATLTRSSDNGSCNARTCSLIWSGQSWQYDDSGLERRPQFYNPILTQSANWKTGNALLGWSSNNDSRIITRMNQPSSSLYTYYYRTTFGLIDASYYTSLNFEITALDGYAVYLNNIEVLRFNLPNGTISNKTLAFNRTAFLAWRSFVVPIKGFRLYNGTNTLAVESHVQHYYNPTSFDLRVSAVKLTSTQPQNVTEICDGIDNNGDGLVDVGSNGKLLTAPCSTPCGTGIMTCINGYFQNCTATVPRPEVCDGQDNNCDGLVDNGIHPLNCGSGTVCWKGACIRMINATKPVQVWPRNSSGWSYYDVGGNIDLVYPNWKAGLIGSTWDLGTAPIGFDNSSPRLPGQWIATYTSFFPADKSSATMYLVKTFTLSSSELAATFNLDFTLRRVDGAIVYLNGVELWRDNMGPGPAKFNTTASSKVCCNASLSFYPCTSCKRNNSVLLKNGTNVVAAELHINNPRSVFMSVFDMDLYRNVYQTCPSAVQCVRQVGIDFIPRKAIWRYIDALQNPPTSDWMLPSYNDSSWSSGTAPIGYGYSAVPLNTVINVGVLSGTNQRYAFYFRSTINLPDASCFFSLNNTLLARDGVVAYINGVEAYRVNVPYGALNSTVRASAYGPGQYNTTVLTGGWLRSNGTNTLAIEVHRYGSSIHFDLLMTGYREAVTCSPEPSSASIPWAN